MKTTTLSLLSVFALSIAAPALAQDAPMVPQIPPRPPAGEMSFFVTSVGMGDGANLGGLAGADGHCQKLAEESGQAGAADKTWRAFLSTQATDDEPAINGRDRIGQGPWYNANGVRIAVNLGQLFGDTLELARKGNYINIRTAVDEFGEIVPGEVRIVGVEARNQHDVLTGSKEDGRAFTDTFDRTCSNWTSNREDGSANVGHHDRITSFTSQSWIDAHPSRGCSQENLISTGGAGQFYCFAID